MKETESTSSDDSDTPSSATSGSKVRATEDAVGGREPPPLSPTVSAMAPRSIADAYATLSTIASAREKADIPELPTLCRERYENATLIGRGGMAVVFRAWDKNLRRHVAIKVTEALGMFSDEWVTRFRREAGAMARLSHPNITVAHDFGIDKNVMWIVMEWVDGRSLRDAIACNAFTDAELIDLLVKIARAVHYAHAQGIVHRDLKPSNILVTKTGEPKVADFGVAHLTETDEEVTRTGIAIGTPAFMAPEQAAGLNQQIGPRTDVYALGAMLYQILTGRPPHFGSGGASTIAQVLTEEPPRPRILNARLSVDIEAIALKALEKDPAARYQSAEALADDLLRYLRGEPILARRATLVYRAQKFARRNKLMVALSTGAAALLSLSLSWGVYTWWHSSARARVAQEFGEKIARIEWLAQKSYLLPLHDVRKERAQIRERMKWIRAEMVRVGSAADGPGHYALGRGHLAVREYEKARGEFEQAIAVGYREPEVLYGLGRAYGGIYQKELDRVRRIEDAKQREQERARIQKAYRDPALRELRNSRGAAASPEYMEALLAFYDEHYDEALKKVAAAERSSEGSYEAYALEGDIHLTMSDELVMREKHDEVSVHYQKAERAFSTAIETARSDPDVLGGLCSVRSSAAFSAMYFGQRSDMKHLFEEGIVYCERALAADPERVQTLLALHHIYRCQGEYANNSGQNARPPLDKAIAIAERALKIEPSSLDGRRSLGRAYAEVAEHLMNFEQSDPTPATNRALVELRQVLSVTPDDYLTWDFIGLTLNVQAEYVMNRGDDPRALLREALAAFKKVGELNPDFFGALYNSALSWTFQGQYESSVGQDPTKSFDKAVSVLKELIARKSKLHYVVDMLIYVYNVRAGYELSRGGDPVPDGNRALALIEHEKSDDAERALVYDNEAGVAAELAENAVLRHEDPSPHLVRTASALRNIDRLEPGSYLGFHHLAEVDWIYALGEFIGGKNPVATIERGITKLTKLGRDIDKDTATQLYFGRLSFLEARYQIRQKQPAEDALARAQKACETALALRELDNEAAAELARVLLLRAETAPDPGRSDEAIGRALELTERTLRKNPRHALALLTRGSLLWLRACPPTLGSQSGPSPSGTESACERERASAKDHLKRGVQANPLLTWAFANELRAAGVSYDAERGAQRSP